MLFNYLKGTSTSVLSSVFTFFLISILFDSGYSFSDAHSEFYNYLTVATLVGIIAGLIAIGILRLYPDQNVFSKDILAIFTVAGIAIGILLDLLYGLSIFPTFLLSCMVGSVMFLIIQKVENKIIGLIIIALHIGLLFIDPQFINFLS